MNFLIWLMSLVILSNILTALTVVQTASPTNPKTSPIGIQTLSGVRTTWAAYNVELTSAADAEVTATTLVISNEATSVISFP